VTGVQTCALPIFSSHLHMPLGGTTIQRPRNGDWCSDRDKTTNSRPDQIRLHAQAEIIVLDCHRHSGVTNRNVFRTKQVLHRRTGNFDRLIIVTALGNPGSQRSIDAQWRTVRTNTACYRIGFFNGALHLIAGTFDNQGSIQPERLAVPGNLAIVKTVGYSTTVGPSFLLLNFQISGFLLAVVGSRSRVSDSRAG